MRPSAPSTNSSAAAPNHARRQYFVKPLFQSRFILQFGVLVAAACACFALAVFLYSRQTLTTAFIHSRLRVMSTSQFLLPALAVIGLAVTAVAAAAAAVRLLLFSHTIAGPLYRLEKTAREVGTGNLALNVRLRAGDQLQELAQSMDEMISELRAQAREIKDQNRRLQDILTQAGGTQAVPRDVLKALEETSQELNKVVGHFRV